MNESELKAQAAVAGLDWEKVKKGLERLLPILETIAKLTPNQYDDAAITFLKSVLAAN